MASNLKHENFVEMLGYCVEQNMLLLAYEDATLGSLQDILHGTRCVFHFAHISYFFLVDIYIIFAVLIMQYKNLIYF